MSSVLSHFLCWHSSTGRLPRAQQASYNLGHLRHQNPADFLNLKSIRNSGVDFGPLPSGTTQERAGKVCSQDVQVPEQGIHVPNHLREAVRPAPHRQLQLRIHLEELNLLCSSSSKGWKPWVDLTGAGGGGVIQESHLAKRFRLITGTS